MLDRRFIPEEIRTEEELHKLMEAKRLEEIAEYLKWAVTNMPRLDPVRFALYVKFKANLLKKGLKLSDQQIKDMSVREIAETLRTQLFGETAKVETQPISEQELEQIKKELGTDKDIPPKTEEEEIKEIVTADVSVIEEERENFRKSLLGEKFIVRIKKGGQLLFRVTRKGNSAEIIIPSSWEIQLEDRLLLDLYDKRFASGNVELPIVRDVTEESEEQKVESGELEKVVEGQKEQQVGEQPTVTEEQSTNVNEQSETQTEGISEEEQPIVEEQTEEQPTVTETQLLGAQPTIKIAEEEQPVNEENVQNEEQPQPNEEQPTESDGNLIVEIVNKYRELNDYYALRSYVMKNLDRFEQLINDGTIPSVEGGKSKVAGHIIAYALAIALNNGDIDESELEGLGNRIMKKITTIKESLQQ